MIGKAWPASVRSNIARVDQRLVASAAGFSTATIHEALGGIGALPSALRPLHATPLVAGSALTVENPPGDNLRMHHALEVAIPGDILVVGCGGAHEHGYWGEIMTIAAIERGIAALVIDGCIRDGDRIAQLGFPVFCRGRCIRGTRKDPIAPGFVNHPLTLGDVTVTPGDLVVGDGDGVVVVPRLRVGELFDKSRAREDREALQMERLTAGETTCQIFGFERSALS